MKLLRCLVCRGIGGRLVVYKGTKCASNYMRMADWLSIQHCANCVDKGILLLSSMRQPFAQRILNV
ncbi:hypothetical protein AKJ16_DCAP25611 [Drosera capensis]